MKKGYVKTSLVLAALFLVGCGESEPQSKIPSLSYSDLRNMTLAQLEELERLCVQEVSHQTCQLGQMVLKDKRESQKATEELQRNLDRVNRNANSFIYGR